MVDDLRLRLGDAFDIHSWEDSAGDDVLRASDAEKAALSVFAQWLRDEAGDIAAHHEGEPGNRHRPIVKHLRFLADAAAARLG